jgi:teichuronic acid biosynthesis glycosyltransferase TuaH
MQADSSPNNDVVFSFGYRTWRDAQPYAVAAPMPSHRMARQFVVDPTVPSVLVADAYRSRLARLKPGYDDAAPFSDAISGRQHVRPVRWRRSDATSLTTTRNDYHRLDRSLALKASRASMRAPVLITCHPVQAATADRSAWADIVYYGWDDWLGYPPMERQRDAIRWAYRTMAQQQTLVIGVSMTITDRIGSPRSAVVPNALTAVDFDDLPVVPSWYRQLKPPVAFYAGALEHRVDVEAILDAAIMLSNWTFCLVGPMPDAEQFRSLAAQPNIIIHPPVAQQEILAMARSSSVGLIPHRRTEMSVSMSPLKLYEYLGAGIPVVAADLPPIRGVSERVLLVEPGSTYAPAIEAAATMPPLPHDELVAWRASNSWEDRYQRFKAAALQASTTAPRLDGKLL